MRNNQEEKILLAWSGGKDSALALYALQAKNDYQVVAFLTTVTEDYDRISMHGVRRTLLEKQADSLGYSLEKVLLSRDSSNEEYEEKMEKVLAGYRRAGVSGVAFGDLFLEEIRKYRENNLARVGMKGIFPIWGRNTSELARNFIGLGFRAIITCVDTKVLDKRFAGQEYDLQLLEELPAGVDPCGENGEFHSFVYAGPMYRREIPFTVGEKVLRDDRFCFCDLIPGRGEGGGKEEL